MRTSFLASIELYIKLKDNNCVYVDYAAKNMASWKQQIHAMFFFQKLIFCLS